MWDACSASAELSMQLCSQQQQQVSSQAARQPSRQAAAMHETSAYIEGKVYFSKVRLVSKVRLDREKCACSVHDCIHVKARCQIVSQPVHGAELRAVIHSRVFWLL